MIRDESDGRTDGAEKYLIWGLICWVTCMCLLNTGVGTREALRARSQMKDLTVHGLGSALQRIKKVYVSHKYSQQELNRSLWREQLEYRLGLSSQKSVWGRFKDSQVPTLMPVHDSGTQRCTRINSKLRPSHDAHHDVHEVLSSVWIRSNFHSQQSYVITKPAWQDNQVLYW